MESTSVDTDVTKHYVDRAVQTDRLASTPRTRDESSTSLIVKALSDQLSDMDMSSPSVLSPSVPQSDASLVADNSAYSRNDSSILSSPPTSIKSSIRVLKKANDGRRGQQETKSLRSISTRIVSLPETMPTFSLKKAHEQMPRVTSNPERLKHRMMSPDDDQSEHSVDFFSGEHRSSRIRVRSTATDIPRTPSPPSSPDSVVIIANKNHLSEDFLRTNSRTQRSSSCVRPDDDGWISWARSPPRPIPALHGPLSLPYARCPSGAEGTIIEEPENLPRVIWGLESEGSSSHRSRLDHAPVAITASVQTSSQPTLSVPHSAPLSATPSKALRQQAAIPPRFHGQISTEDGLLSHIFNPVYHDRYEHTHTDTDSKQTQGAETARHEYLLPEHGPIDLSNIVRPRMDMYSNGYAEDYNFLNSKYGSFGHDHRAYNSPEHMDMEWQSLRLTQERLKNLSLGLPLSAPASVEELGRFVTPSVSASSLSSVATSRSPIILNPPSHLPQSSRPVISHRTQDPVSQEAPRRMSALEIAQNYRQRQVLQERKRHAMLPTPPDSTSPLWSSAFSPYQDSLLSPEVLAAARLPNILASKAPLVGRPHPLLQRAERKLQAQLSDLERLSSLGVGAVTYNQQDLTFLTPHLQDVTAYQDTLHSGGFDAAALNMSDRIQYHPCGTRNVSLRAGSTVQSSPVVLPRPPPNTPLGAHSPDTKHGQAFAQSMGGVAPLSPTSPRQTQNIQQHARSIPLSRLIRRRLSSVPEEDSGLLSDRKPSSPVRPVAEAVSGVSTKNYVPPEEQARTAKVPTNQTKDSEVRGCDESRERRPSRNDRGRGNRGGRGRRGRPPLKNVINGPERVDGGMTVRS